MDSKKLKTFDLRFWLSLLVFALIVACICTFPIWFTSQKSMYDFNTTGQIGDTIGGTMGPFVAIAAAILTFLAFWVQYKANEQQKVDIEEQKKRYIVERLESRFLEMVKMHRENIIELEYVIPQKNIESKDDIARSRKVFVEIFSDFESLIKETSFLFEQKEAEDIYEMEYLSKLKSNNCLVDRKIDFLFYAKIDILYCIIYYGASKNSIDILTNLFNSRYNAEFIKSIIQFVRLKPKKNLLAWNAWNGFNLATPEEKRKILEIHANEILGNKNPISKSHFANEWETYKRLKNVEKADKYYGGHQFRLAHYFRHIYQSVNMINDTSMLNYNKKYENIKILRGQLSNFEQIFLFLNSLSIIGRIWELEHPKRPSEEIEINNQLITKYNLIKNIANDVIIEGVKASDFYPLVSYEAQFIEANKLEREKLELLYK